MAAAQRIGQPRKLDLAILPSQPYVILCRYAARFISSSMEIFAVYILHMPAFAWAKAMTAASCNAGSHIGGMGKFCRSQALSNRG